MKFELPCRIETRISEKSGKEYVVVIIQLTPTYEKKVFLDSAEVELAAMTYGNNHSQKIKISNNQ